MDICLLYDEMVNETNKTKIKGNFGNKIINQIKQRNQVSISLVTKYNVDIQMLYIFENIKKNLSHTNKHIVEQSYALLEARTLQYYCKNKDRDPNFINQVKQIYDQLTNINN